MTSGCENAPTGSALEAGPSSLASSVRFSVFLLLCRRDCHHLHSFLIFQTEDLTVLPASTGPWERRASHVPAWHDSRHFHKGTLAAVDLLSTTCMSVCFHMSAFTKRYHFSPVLGAKEGRFGKVSASTHQACPAHATRLCRPSDPLHGGCFTIGVVGAFPGAFPADGQQGQEITCAGGWGHTGLHLRKLSQRPGCVSLSWELCSAQRGQSRCQPEPSRGSLVPRTAEEAGQPSHQGRR